MNREEVSLLAPEARARSLDSIVVTRLQIVQV